MMVVCVGCAERIARPAWRPSYSMPESVRLKDGDTFEYVVVGAGAAGSAVAARLALAGKDVLLIEAGDDPNFISKKPGLADALLGSSLDYQYETVSNNESCLSYDKKQCVFSRGRCLGGSTSINYMIHTRGHPKDFDDLNIEGWSWEDMKPYFLRFEGLQDLSKLPPESKPFHNTTGPMKMQFFADSENSWHPRIIQAFEELNFPYNPDVNAASKIGVSQIIGYVFKNERMSTARGYLSRDDVKKRLKVAKSTKCTGLTLSDDDKPQGVKVIHGIFKRKMTIYAKKEIILSAGALITPQILMLSGVGPAEHLQQFDIPVRVDLSVGHNMSDHVLPLLFVKVDKSTSNTGDLIQAGKVVANFADLLFRQQGPFTSNGLTDVCAFLNTDCYDFDKRQLRNDSSECEVPNVQYIHAYLGRNLIPLSGPLFQNGVGLNDAVTEQLSKVNEDYALIVFSPLLLRPHSLGHVRLGSGDPEDQPAIFPNFLADKRDVDLMVSALTIVEHLMESQPFKKNGADIVRLEFPDCPAYTADRVGYWRCYSRHMTQSTFHSVGTSALGRVLDARLRVRGARRVRVADLGAMPELPRGNTAAAAIAIGERAADFILSENY